MNLLQLHPQLWEYLFGFLTDQSSNWLRIVCRFFYCKLSPFQRFCSAVFRKLGDRRIFIYPKLILSEIVRVPLGRGEVGCQLGFYVPQQLQSLRTFLALVVPQNLQNDGDWYPTFQNGTLVLGVVGSSYRFLRGAKSWRALQCSRKIENNITDCTTDGICVTFQIGRMYGLGIVLETVGKSGNVCVWLDFWVGQWQ
jgi:hypothetical protein